MNRPAKRTSARAAQALGFTDNRQDAALQAGHFNDFLFVTLLRAASSRPSRRPGRRDSEDAFGGAIQLRSASPPATRSRRPEWMLDPDGQGCGPVEAERTLRQVLAYRVWSDQRRGWRYTNPNLEELGSGSGRLPGARRVGRRRRAFADAPPELRNATPRRAAALRILLDAPAPRSGDHAEALDPSTLSDGNAPRAKACASRGRISSRRAARPLADHRRAEARQTVARRSPDPAWRPTQRTRQAAARPDRLGRGGWTGKTYLPRFRRPESRGASISWFAPCRPASMWRAWRLAANAVRLVAAARARADGRAPKRYFVALVSDAGRGACRRRRRPVRFRGA